jgi:hypothetical protein
LSFQARTPAAVIVSLGYVASLAADFPGHFPPDALWQLAQGRAGRYNAWHPPIMAWLLGLADRVHPGAWLFVIVNGALFYGGLFAVAALERRPRPICLPLLVLWMASPIVLVLQGVVIKDVLFANAALAGFAALAWAGRCWTSPLRRGVLLAASVLLLALASLTRQNGFVAPFFGALALAAIVNGRLTPGRGAGLARAGLWAVGALAVVGLVDFLAVGALAARSDGRPENANHLKVLQVYDLAGALRGDPALPLPIVHAGQPALERFLRDQAAPHYRPAGADNLFALPGAMMTPPGAAVGRQWADLIREHPWLYAGTRARVWWTTLDTPGSAGCPLIITGIDGDRNLLARAGLRARDDAKDDWDEDYALRFVGGPLYSHVAYAALLIGSLLWLAAGWLRGDRRPETLVTAALGLSALAFAASFFVVSVDCDYRFLYFLDVAAMAVLTRVVAASALPARVGTGWAIRKRANL